MRFQRRAAMLVTFPLAKVILELLLIKGQPRDGNPPWEEGVVQTPHWADL